MTFSLTLDKQGRHQDIASDIAQSIAVIVGTPKGTKIHDPDFGCDLWGAIDRPIGRVPSAVAEVIRAIRRDEPRVTVQSVEPDFSAAAEGRVTLLIRYIVVSTGETVETTVTV